jgi:hypothetical protein
LQMGFVGYGLIPKLGGLPQSIQGSYTIVPAPVPEPGSAIFLLTGIAAITGALGRRPPKKSDLSKG